MKDISHNTEEVQDQMITRESAIKEAIKEILEEVADCECMGEISKLLRRYGIK